MFPNMVHKDRPSWGSEGRAKFPKATAILIYALKFLNILQFLSVPLRAFSMYVDTQYTENASQVSM